MNFKLDLTKISDFYQKTKKYYPVLIVTFFVILFSVLTFLALYPFRDETLISEGQTRLEELDINFNTKVLNELETKQQPTQITGVGGRDPFAGF